MLKPSTPGKIERVIFELEGLVHADSLDKDGRFLIPLSLGSLCQLVGQLRGIVEELEEHIKSKL